MVRSYHFSFGRISSSSSSICCLLLLSVSLNFNLKFCAQIYLFSCWSNLNGRNAYTWFFIFLLYYAEKFPLLNFFFSNATHAWNFFANENHHISSRIKDQVLLRMWSILLHFSIENCNDIWLNWYDCLFFPWRIANSLLALNKWHICHVKRHSEHTIYVLGMLMLTEHEHKYMCSCQQVFVKHATNRTT